MSSTVPVFLTVLCIAPGVGAQPIPDLDPADLVCGIEPRHGDQTDFDVDENRRSVWFTVYASTPDVIFKVGEGQDGFSTGAEVAPFCKIDTVS